MKNGTAALSRLVWWAIGIGATLVIGAGAFFSTTYLGSLDARITRNATNIDLRNERINLIEGRLNTLSDTSSASLDAIIRKLDRMETWQEQVRQDMAELKVAVKAKP